MSQKFQDLPDDFEIPEIDIGIPADEILEKFNNELKHHLASILGSAEIISIYPDEEARQRSLEIIFLNLRRMEKLRGVVTAYLEKRSQSK